MAIVIVSGYFNPIHKGHIEYIKKATEYGSWCIAIVNNDFQVKLKGATPFQNEEERMFITVNIKGINEVMLSIDKDRSVSKSLERLRKELPKDQKIFFVNGGDVDKCLEEETCKKLEIEVIYGLGKKIQSSSWLKNKTS